jgi:hypothetical protein
VVIPLQRSVTPVIVAVFHEWTVFFKKKTVKYGEFLVFTSQKNNKGKPKKV